MKRKLFTLFLLLTMVFAVGCNKKDKNPDPTPTPVPTSTPTPTPTPVPVNLAKDNLEKLVTEYDKLMELEPNNQYDLSKGVGYDMTIDFSLGDQIKNLLGITDLDTLRLSAKVDMKDAISMDMGLFLNSSEVINAVMLMDSENVMMNLPKYSSSVAAFSMKEVLESADTGDVDIDTLTYSINPANAMALSEELMNSIRTLLTDLVACFKEDSITPKSSIGNGDYVMTGDKHTVKANPQDVIAVLKSFEAAMEKIYGELDFDWSDLESAEATALFLDYYTDETGNYAWSFRTDEYPEDRIVFINTGLGFSLYKTEDGVTTPGMNSIKSTEDTGVIYLYFSDEELAEGELAEPMGTIDYEYRDNYIHADIVVDTIEATVDFSTKNDITIYDVTLVMEGMSFVIKETASKEGVDMSMTLASYGIEYATINIGMILRDYNEVTIPQNVVDPETWATGLDQIALLTDLTQLMQEYPFLAALFNSTEDEGGEDQPTEPFVLPEGYTDDFMGMTGWNVDSDGYVDFEPLESEVLAAGKPSTGLESMKLQDHVTQALLAYAPTYFNEYSTYTSYWVGGYAQYNDVQSFYTTDYYFSDSNNENNLLIIEFDAVTGALISVSLYYQYQEEAVRIINEILSVMEVDFAVSAHMLNEYTEAHNFAFSGFDGAEFGEDYYYISFYVNYTE